MAETANKSNKKLVIGICTAVVAIIAIVVVVFFLNKEVVLNDDYFVSDGSKYVLNLGEEYNNMDPDYAPIMTHWVYYYSGNIVTGFNMYYEYSNAESAKSAYDKMAAINYFNAFKSATVDGKYIVIEQDKSAYEDYTADDIKQQVENLEKIQDLLSEDEVEEEE